MIPSAIGASRYFQWAIGLSIAFFLFLIIYPFLVRIVIPAAPDPAPVRGGNVVTTSNAPPVTLIQLGAKAADELAHPPAGLKSRTDIEAKLYAAAHYQVASPQLASAARLLAQKMVRDGFRSDIDPDGMGPGNRIALIDRHGLYSAPRENYADAKTSNPATDFTNIKAGLDAQGVPAALSIKAYNRIGSSCVELRQNLVCVHLLAHLGGQFASPLPYLVRGDRIPAMAVTLSDPGAAVHYWRLTNPIGVEVGRDVDLAQIRPGSGFKGQASLDIVENLGGSDIELGGPSLEIQ